MSSIEKLWFQVRIIKVKTKNKMSVWQHDPKLNLKFKIQKIKFKMHVIQQFSSSAKLRPNTSDKLQNNLFYI